MMINLGSKGKFSRTFLVCSILCADKNSKSRTACCGCFRTVSSYACICYELCKCCEVFPTYEQKLVRRSLLTVKLVDFAYKKSQVLIYTNRKVLEYNCA